MTAAIQQRSLEFWMAMGMDCGNANRIALNAGWDEALLAAEFAKLQEMGDLDLALTGFDFDETDRLLATLEPVATQTGNPQVASGDASGNQAMADPLAEVERTHEPSNMPGRTPLP